MATQQIALVGGTPKEIVAAGSLAAGQHTVQNVGREEIHLVNKATALADVTDALDEIGIVVAPLQIVALDVTSSSKTYAWSPAAGELTIDT